MTDSIQLYDVKVVVMSALKLLPEIKRLLSSNPNRLNLFRRTVLGPWLDLPSHYNDNHLMHYVLQHQVHVSEITSECPPIIFHIGDHMLHFGRKEFCLLTGFRLGVMSLKHENLSCFCTRVFPDILTEKDIRKLKSCHLLALVRDKKGWAGLHDIDVVQHHLDGKKKNPNYNATYNLYGFAWAFKDSIPTVNLDPTPPKKIQAWFDSSIQFFNGIVDEDGKGCGDDSVLVSKDNFVVEDFDEDCNMCEDASAGLSKDSVVNKKSVGNNDHLLLEDGDGLFYSEAGCKNSEEDNENQPANVSIQNTKPNMIPNLSDGIPSCFVPDLNSNQTGVDQDLGGATNDPISICSRPDMHNVEVGCDGMASDKPDQMNDYNCSQPIPASVDALIQACAYVADHPELDVLQPKAHVDRSGPMINQHPMAEPLTADEFRDDYMSVLNDEEMIPNVSLDDMKFSSDYKPPLETVFAANIKSKIKKSGLQKNYVLRSIQDRKKRLATPLGSLYGQLGTTTPTPPKTRSMTSIRDTIVTPKFEEISGQPKIRSLNEFLTLQVFVENLSRPDECKKDNLACLDLAKKGWLGDSHLNLWVDLMWSFREPDADWAMVGPYFLPCILGGSMHDYFPNGVRGFGVFQLVIIGRLLFGTRFGAPPDTLDPTIVRISHPISGQVVGGLIYWLGHERSVSNSGVFNNKTLLVSFEMNTHQFEVIDILDIIIRPLGFSLTISNFRNSLLLSGNVFPPDNFIFVGQLLSINDGSITSFNVMYTIPSLYFMKLLGFNNQDEPVVEAAKCHCRGHSVQVYNPESDSFNNVTQILGNAGSFYVGPYKESIILTTYPDHSHYCAG
nr:hypothetical protein [Tanacetum cinerariifolium]